MELLQGVITLMGVAVLLLQLSRRFSLPYPSILALAGILIAFVPFLPTIVLAPDLALAIFVTPALFDAAYVTTWRDLKAHWLALLFLAVAAVIVTTGIVGLIGHLVGGLGWAAALTLGAIVSPPDASAVGAVVNRFSLPRRALLILEGESLLNDATALLLFGTARTVVIHGPHLARLDVGQLILAIPGGAFLGFLLGRSYLAAVRWTAGSLSTSVLEIAITFGAWILSERLHLSPILAVVVLAMTISKGTPRQQPPRDRIHLTALWGSLTFTLSTLAFLLLGMQVLDVSQQLKEVPLAHAVAFGGVVFAATIVIRIVWVFTYRWIAIHLTASPRERIPSAKITFLTSWCGIRGILTIATASALPQNFQGRNLIVFAAFSVVLGTLILQGFTLGPLIRLLEITPDDSFQQETQHAREMLIRIGLDSISSGTNSAAVGLRRELESALQQVDRLDFSAQSSGIDKLRRRVIEAQRRELILLRESGRVEEDVFQALQEELDWAALAASPANDLAIEKV